MIQLNVINYLFCIFLGTKRIANSSQIKVTKMLLIVSTVFVCLNLPSYAMRIKAFLISDVSQWETNKKKPYYVNTHFKRFENWFYNFNKSNLFSIMFSIGRYLIYFGYLSCIIQ